MCARVCGGLQAHCDGLRTCNYSAEPFRYSGALRGSLICIRRYSRAFAAGAATRGVHARTRNALTSANKHLPRDHRCDRTRSTENGDTSAPSRITDAVTAFGIGATRTVPRTHTCRAQPHKEPNTKHEKCRSVIARRGRCTHSAHTIVVSSTIPLCARRSDARANGESGESLSP